jgi:nucleoside-diphosphate-sugar epimerase
MKNVIVSGATSMLGLALLEQCIIAGVNIQALIQKGSPKRFRIPRSPLVRVIECDLDEYAFLNIPAGDYDVFYHFAWSYTDNASRNLVEEQARNIQYTLDALKLAGKCEVKRFVGAGSQAEYGLARGIISPTAKVAPVSAYGIAKYSAGRMASILAKQIGMCFIWTRVFSTYGVNDMDSTMIMYCIGKLLKGELPILTKCEQKWDYLNCRDAAKAFFLLGEQGKDQEIYNIGSGIARPLRDYVETMRDCINPALPLGIGKREYAADQIMYLCADIENLVRDTSFQAEIDFYAGIKEVIEWCNKARNNEC